jgi:xylulose-5-phosphate/fructose-6-phosphate phosphoketolase
LANYFEGLGWNPYFVEGTNPKEVHEMMAKTLDFTGKDGWIRDFSAI